jgi:hypothetical protein
MAIHGPVKVFSINQQSLPTTNIAPCNHCHYYEIMSVNHLITTIEKYIRSGHNIKAREILLPIIRERNLKLNLEALEIIANQCRRVQLSNVAIQLLSPYVKAFREGITKNLAPRTRVEYAMALHRLGGSTGAKLLLIDPVPIKHYLSNLYLGLIHLSEWEYEKARVCFQNFLNTNGLDSYESCLGKLNLIGTDIFLNIEVSSLEGRIKALLEITLIFLQIIRKRYSFSFIRPIMRIVKISLNWITTQSPTYDSNVY